MKPFGWKQFRANNYTIPNADNKLVITEEIVRDSYDRDMPAIRIEYDNKLLMRMFKSTYGGRTIDVQAQYAFELGLIVDPNMEGFSAILDGLFYKFNRFEPTSVKGKIYKKSFLALKQRSVDRCWYNSVYTQKLLKVCTQYLHDSLVREGFADQMSLEYITAMQSKLRDLSLHDMRVCAVSGTVSFSWMFRRTRIHEKVVAILSDITDEMIKSMGYTYSNSENCWMKKGYGMFRGRVYKKVESKRECPTCGNNTPESFFEDDNECVFCAERSYEIHNYSTRVPTLLKFKASKVRPKEDPLYLGIELEFETTDREAARLRVGKALKGHAIMKSDGSIRNGFEVVTCPATIDIQLEIFKEFYENRPQELRNASNVGMHVHVSRKPLSLLTIGKLTEFMNRSDNRPFIQFVGGRILNSYCSQGNRSVTYPWTNQSGGERYNTLNLSNRDTIEFRIFSTPLTFSEFASRVEFVQALVEYSKPCMQSASLKSQTYFQSFIDWVNRNRKDYPELNVKLKGFA